MTTTTTTYEEAVAIVDEMAATKSRQDLAAAAALYHPDGVLESPPMGARSHGSEIHDGLAGWFTFAPDYRVTLTGKAMDGDTLCTWGEISFTPTLTATGAVPDGRTVTTPVFILFRFADGKAIWESFWFDLVDAARQCGVAPTDLVLAS